MLRPKEQAMRNLAAESYKDNSQAEVLNAVSPTKRLRAGITRVWSVWGLRPLRDVGSKDTWFNVWVECI